MSGQDYGDDYDDDWTPAGYDDLICPECDQELEDGFMGIHCPNCGWDDLNA